MKKKWIYILCSCMLLLAGVTWFASQHDQKKYIMNAYTENGTLLCQMWDMHMQAENDIVSNAAESWDTCVFYEPTIAPAYDFHINNYALSAQDEEDIINTITAQENGKSMLIIKTTSGTPLYIFTGYEIQQKNMTTYMVDGKQVCWIEQPK